jgi:FkbH-like protein
MMTESEVRAVLARSAGDRHAARVEAVETLDRSDYPWPRSARLRILRNYTCEPLESFLKLAGYRRDTQLHLSFGGYDTYLQEILDPRSELEESPPDAVILSLWLEALPMAFDGDGRLQVEATVDHVQAAIARLRERVSSLIFINTFLPASHQLGYPYGCRADNGLRAVNGAVTELADRYPSVVVVDFEALEETVGANETRDPRYWFMFKSPLAARFLSAWADVLAQAISSSQGGQRKVLAIDCDNTLWGGICGEDGIGAIKLSAHDYPGNVFRAFQRQLLELQRRGVLLVLCSKNNEADVFEVLDHHPDCVLRRRHLAGWRINWRDKASNLSELADELHLGLDSFVFIDDSPIETALIRRVLPMVDVLDVPLATHALPGVLGRYAGFFSVVRTQEDAVRTGQYEAERQRRRRSSLYADHEEFLASLDLVADVGPALPDELARVAQLTQKTNQFNLTTKRYGEGQIEQLVESEASAVLVLRARDKYGDYGLTGVAIVITAGDGCHVESFLLSCRVLGRHLEDVLLDEVVDHASERWHSTEVTADFIVSPKNCQVATFYQERGFVVVSSEDPRTTYKIASGAYQAARPAVVSVQRRATKWKNV